MGPTASGKTALSIELAKRFHGEVISADSRQIYRGLDIGTEKVSKEEMDGVPHHLIDIVEPETVYTAADFKRDAEAAISEIASRGALPVIAGGTFFYIDALIGAASLPEVSPDHEFRRKMELLPTETLVTALIQIDPVRATQIDQHNKRRVIRALEIVKALGKVPVPQTGDEQYDALWIGVSVPKDELRQRIRVRAKRALDRGLVEETKHLLAHGVSKDRLLAIGLEYPIVIEYLEGNLPESALPEKLEEKNWQYAKRQLTWLKRNKRIQWYTRDDSKIIETVEEFLGS